MRYNRGATLALLCAILLTGSAAYSETRSFRDALDGRSMEDAISGPVDKDTSSYGDRNSGGSSAMAGNAMLSIPANGNLNGKQQQQPERGYGSGADDQQQQQQKGESELEREAGPIGDGPMDSQQMMEQKSSRQRAMNPRSMNGRQQQQQESDFGSGAKGAGSEPNFGDEPASKGAAQPAYGAGKQPAGEQKPMGGYGQGEAAEQQPTTGGPGEQQQVMNGNSDQAEKGYGAEEQQQMSAKQRAMAAMLMSMTNGMKYSRSQQQQAMGGQYGDKRQPTGGMHMMMSLANKAAYMANQQSQRQMAPPMMMGAQGGYSGRQQQAGGYQAQGGKPMSAMLMNGGAMPRQMRRANQRKAERKMSPAMVNAMLNKMMSMKQEQEPEEGAGSAGYGPKKPSAMAMLMKSPLGAEMLASVMMGSGAQLGGATAGMSPAKRAQYKRMMMSAMQQQQTQESDYGAGQEQEQQQMSGYGSGAKAGGAAKNAAAGNGDYGMGGMSPMALMMSMMNGASKPSYSMMGQQPAMSMMNGEPKYGQKRKMSKSSGNDYPEQQSQMDAGGYGGEQQQMDTQGGKSMMGGRGRPMSMMMPRGPMGTTKSAGGYMNGNGNMNGNMNGNGNEQKKYGSGDQQQREMPSTMMPPMMATGGYGASDGMDSPLPATTMSGKGAPATMNGMRQSYSPQQEQAPMGMSMMSYPAAGGAGKTSSGNDYKMPAGMMRPQQPAAGGYGDQQQQQEQDSEQQQEEEGYGAAPMGQAEPFAFDYKVEDDYGNGQYRKEESDKNGVVRGSYGYTDVKGIYRHVEYVADENGFRANIKSNEPGLSSETVPSSGAASGQDQQQQQQQLQSPMDSARGQQDQQQQMSDSGEN